MSMGLIAYRLVTRLIAPALGPLMRRRAGQGKEDRARLNERFAKTLPPRLKEPSAGPLIWLHGASVGESQLLLALGHRLLQERPDLMLLFTSQTQTSAQLLGPALPDRALHQMAPLDTPAAAGRFMAHWRPAVCIFAEGEIWPNLIGAAEASGAARILVNARMTNQSLQNWGRFRGLLRRTLGRFDTILAADDATATGLGRLLDRVVPMPGNLKSALPPPGAADTDVARLQRDFIAGRRCVLAASTHAGEDALFLTAAAALPETALILAPRHPERAAEIKSIIRAHGLSSATRSAGEIPNTDTDILLADTMGEMGLWYRLADAIYLGGGHAPNVGGHNPLEALRLSKPVISGPDVFNFASVWDDLSARGLGVIAADGAALTHALKTAMPPDADALAALNADADAPMAATLEAIRPFLPPPIQTGAGGGI